MDRDAFVKRYMEGSGLTPYELDGETVTFREGSFVWINHALPCHCEEDDCEGWAMVPNGSQNWHKFQNGLTDMTFAEATAADRQCRENKRRPFKPSWKLP